MLRGIIHCWDEDSAVCMLVAVRRALVDNGRVLIIERVIATPTKGRDAKISDLNMLVNPGGRERTREEFAVLLESSGLRLERVLDAGILSVVEAAKA